MSLTARNVTNGEALLRGYLRVSLQDFTYDSSYPAGGYPLNPNLFRMSHIEGIQWLGVSGGTFANGAGLLPVLDNTNRLSPKVRLVYPTGGISPASVGEPSATATPASGATAVTSTSAQPAIPVALTGGLGIEVATGTNLSTVIHRVMLIGS